MMARSVSANQSNDNLSDVIYIVSANNRPAMEDMLAPYPTSTIGLTLESYLSSMLYPELCSLIDSHRLHSIVSFFSGLSEGFLHTHLLLKLDTFSY
jgi:hypothetical protein